MINSCHQTYTKTHAKAVYKFEKGYYTKVHTNGVRKVEKDYYTIVCLYRERQNCVFLSILVIIQQRLGQLLTPIEQYVSLAVEYRYNAAP